jgi:hypothetical protein
MAQAPIVTGTAPAGGAVTLLARILGQNAQPLTYESLASIAITVTDLTSGAVLASNAPLVPSAVVFDQLQYDPRWTKDTPQAPAPPVPLGDGLSGYNFLTVIPAAWNPTIGDTIQARVTFTPLVGQPLVQVWQWLAI